VPRPPDRGFPVGLVAGVVLVAIGLGTVVAAATVWLTGDDSDAPPPAPALAGALAAAEASTEPFRGLTETQLGVGDRCLRVVIVDEPRERSDGLRGYEELGPYDGMLFVFDTPSTSSFTMSGVTVPLDIGWYDETGRPVDTAEMEPCPEADSSCPSYPATGPYRFALETLGGEFVDGSLGACPS